MDAQHSQTLAGMQTTYDAAVAHWSDTAVEYHNYKPYGTIFDRNVAWSTKAGLMRGKRKK